METRDGGSMPASPLPYSYAALPDDAEAAVVGRGRRTGPLLAAILLASAALLLAVAALARVRLAGQLPATGVAMSGLPTMADVAMSTTTAGSRGPESGVSEKTSGIAAEHGGMLGTDAGSNAFPWSNAMLQWQRTGFHFQPEKNWMNDPNGTYRHIYFRH
jgi:beta-fructofuranosidase